MMSRDARTPRSPRPGRRWVRRLHRWFGLASCLFLLLIALSGVALNHADRMALSQRPAALPFVVALYGIDAPAIETAYAARGSVVALAGGFVTVDGNIVAESRGLVGAVAVRDGLLTVTDDELLLFTPDGMLVERVSSPLPAGVQRLGSDGDTAVIDAGERRFRVDTAMMTLQPVTAWSRDPDWAQSVLVSDEQARRIGAAVLGRTLNWSRVLNDVHSGRLLPGAGPVIVDLAALCLVYLAVSGLYLGLRRNRAERGATGRVARPRPARRRPR